MPDPYLDPVSGILRNKLGLTEDAALHMAEAAAARINATVAMQRADAARHLNEKSLKAIHHTLFSDIYAWAGDFRSVYLRKAHGGLPFAPPARLAGQMRRRILPAFHKLARRAGADDRVFTDALAQCWGELTELHPFREGNGRAIQIFVAALAHRYNRDIDWSRIQQQPERDAAIAAMTRNYVPYADLLRSALRPWDRSRFVHGFWIERDEDRS